MYICYKVFTKNSYIKKIFSKYSHLLFCESFRLASSSVTYLQHKNLLQKSYTNSLIINTEEI